MPTVGISSSLSSSWNCYRISFFTTSPQSWPAINHIDPSPRLIDFRRHRSGQAGSLHVTDRTLLSGRLTRCHSQSRIVGFHSLRGSTNVFDETSCLASNHSIISLYAQSVDWSHKINRAVKLPLHALAYRWFSVSLFSISRMMNLGNRIKGSK